MISIMVRVAIGVHIEWTEVLGLSITTTSAAWVYEWVNKCYITHYIHMIQSNQQ